MTASLLVLAGLVAAHADVAYAHDRRVGRAVVTAEGPDVVAIVELRTIDLTAFAAAGAGDVFASPDSLVTFLHAHLQASRASRRCAPIARPSELRNVAPGLVRTTLHLRCAASGPLVLRSHLHDTVAGYALLVHVRDGAMVRDGVLAERSPTFTLARDEAPARTFLDLVAAGAEHLRIGIDHLAFLLLVLLGARGFRDAAFAVTGFTLGHATTLAVVALGAFRVDADRAESMIAGTIALASLSLGRASRVDPAIEPPPPPTRELVVHALVVGAVVLLTASAHDASAMRLAVGAAIVAASHRAASDDGSRFVASTLFGLVHGLGFASALAELGGGPVDLRTLAGFNLGIELAQLGVVLMALPAYAWFRRHELARARVRLAAATVTAFLAGVWWVERSGFTDVVGP